MEAAAVHEGEDKRPEMTEPGIEVRKPGFQWKLPSCACHGSIVELTSDIAVAWTIDSVRSGLPFVKKR